MTAKKEIKKIEVEQLPITLVQFLKWAGVVESGSQAKAFVNEGNVWLNDEICLIKGKQLKNGDEVKIVFLDFNQEENQLIFKIIEA